jgi:Ca2+-binding RTX toxin-like protein
VLPASAQGATASADTFIVENDFQTIAITTVRYIAAPGEANAVVARYAAAGIVFTETGAPLQAGAGCAQTAPGEVTCSRDPRTNELDVTVDTRDGDDRVALQLGTPTQGANRRAIQVFAGDGADEITKDGSGGGAVWLDGGAGADRVVGGPGGGALVGGSGADTLIGGPDGQLLAGDGLRQVTAPPSTPNDTPVDTGPDGDDTIDGGAGVDTATWAGRTTGVTVDLAAGTGGSPGRDADRVTGVENAIGTKQADTLRGDGGPNDLDGNDGGRDTIDGLGGNDKLSADRGVVRGGPGNDFLSPFDGEARCGSGVDYLNPFGAYSSSDARSRERSRPTASARRSSTETCGCRCGSRAPPSSCG